MSLWPDSEGRVGKLFVTGRTKKESQELYMRVASTPTHAQDEAVVVIWNQGLDSSENRSGGEKPLGRD